MIESSKRYSVIFDQMMLDLRLQKARTSPERGSIEYIRKLFYDRSKLGSVNIAEIMAFFSEGSKILDIGCGNGNFIREIQTVFPVNAFGIDFDQERVKKNNIPNVIAASWTDVPFEDRTFDRLVSSESFPRYPTGYRSIVPPENEISVVSNTMRELARVATPGAIWRGILPHEADLGNKDLYTHNPELVENMPAIMENNGWKLETVRGNLFVAVRECT